MTLSQDQPQTTPNQYHLKTFPTKAQFKNSPTQDQLKTFFTQVPLKSSPTQAQFRTSPTKAELRSSPTQHQPRTSLSHQEQPKGSLIQAQLRTSPTQNQLKISPTQTQLRTSPTHDQMKTLSKQAQLRTFPTQDHANDNIQKIVECEEKAEVQDVSGDRYDSDLVEKEETLDTRELHSCNTINMDTSSVTSSTEAARSDLPKSQPSSVNQEAAKSTPDQEIKQLKELLEQLNAETQLEIKNIMRNKAS